MAQAMSEFASSTQAGKLQIVTAGYFFFCQHGGLDTIWDPNPHNREIGVFVMSDDLAIFGFTTIAKQHADFTFVLVVGYHMPSGNAESLVSVFNSFFFVDGDDHTRTNSITRNDLDDRVMMISNWCELPKFGVCTNSCLLYTSDAADE